MPEMTWKWPQDKRSIAFACEVLSLLDYVTKREIAAEWVNSLGSSAGIPPLEESALNRWIWRHASGVQHGRTCSMNGYELWLCPSGCHVADLRDMPADWVPSA